MNELFDKFIESNGSLVIEEKDHSYIEKRFWKYVEENEGFSKCPECGKIPDIYRYGECKIKREMDIKERNVKLWYKGLFPNKEFPCVQTFYGENAKDIDFPIYISHIKCCIYIYPWNLKQKLVYGREVKYFESEYVVPFNTLFDHIDELIPYDYYLKRKDDEEGPNTLINSLFEEFEEYLKNGTGKVLPIPEKSEEEKARSEIFRKERARERY